MTTIILESTMALIHQINPTDCQNLINSSKRLKIGEITYFKLKD
jgi:hypothetical protein